MLWCIMSYALDNFLCNNQENCSIRYVYILTLKKYWGNFEDILCNKFDFLEI